MCSQFIHTIIAAVTTIFKISRGRAFSIFRMRLFSLLTLLGSAFAVVFEAENAVLSGGLDVATAVPGFSGTGYVANFQTSNDTILFNITGLAAGSYDIAVVYSAQYGNKYTSVAVNGAASEVAINNVTASDCKFSLEALQTFDDIPTRFMID